MSLDNNFERLGKVLDTVTDAVSGLSKEREEMREEQTASISNLSRLIDTKTNTLTEKCGKLESKIRKTENNMVDDMNAICSQNKTVHLEFNKRIMSLEHQIILMDEAIASLKTKHDENTVIINELRPKAGKKRKWWQIGI